MTKKQNTNSKPTITTNYLEETQRFTHDLKAPLMILNSSFLKEAQYIPSQELVRKSIERVYQMSREYLQTLETEESKQSSLKALESLSLSEVKRLLKHKLASVPLLAAQSGIHCTPKLYNFVGLQRLVSTNLESDFIQASGLELQRIIDNVILNAIEAMSAQKPQHTIICSVLLEGSNLVIQIQDSGEGCNTKTRNQIFSKQFRSNKTNGKGIGLKCARANLETWGARLDFESAPGKGSTVTLTLPLQVGPQVHEIN